GLNTNPNVDLIAILIMLAFFLILFFLPLIPGLNRLPLWIGFYKLVWRDWYKKQQGSPTRSRK
ncbi:MAG TPA: hypothetical protein VMU36_02820, partial [Spirochaetia bacterium]|nr:hypothetical protein [Spirochaetia bacterium]